MLWLVSGTLQRFDPATGRFIAYRLRFPRNGKRRTAKFPCSCYGQESESTEDSFLAIDHSGVLWVATTNGLLRFDREREQFTIYDERDGLPASSVNGILEDRNGNLWVSTAGGLSRFNPRTKTFTNYYEADGLAGNAFEGFPAACQSRRGQMFFGSKSGLTSFWPEQIVEKPSIPPVVLTGFSLRNEPVAPGRGLGARTVHHFYAVADTVSRAEHVLLRVRRSELRGSTTEPVSVHARETRPCLERGGRRSGAWLPSRLARGKLHAARSGLEQSRRVE